ncbi:MAG: TIGR03619 family F420-dependent LLM class oxidoreductase [Acidimicrobiales bacterium]
MPDNVIVRQGDVEDIRLPGEHFDIVHARAVLQHVPARDAVLDTLIAALKPGGWLVVEDGQFTGFADQDLPEPYQRIHRIIAYADREEWRDPDFGLRVLGRLRSRGLVELDAVGDVWAMRPGEPGGEWWFMALDRAVPHLVAAGMVAQDDADAALAQVRARVRHAELHVDRHDRTQAAGDGLGRGGPVKLGVHLPQYGRAATPDAIARVARHAEELGFVDVWVSDHVVRPEGQTYPSAYLFEPLLTLGWAAAATDRVGLGTSVMVVPQYHPLVLANSLATLDRLAGGRVVLGVGVGWSEAEFVALDQDFATRGRRLDEALAIFRAVWSDDPVDFSGAHYRFDALKLQPKPARPIPIWVGGTSDAAVMRAAALGDGYHAISTPPEQLGRLVERIGDERARLGRTEPFTVSYRTGWDPQGMDPGVIADEAAAYAEAGVSHVVSAPWRDNVDDWLRSMDLLVEIVGR